MGLAFCYVETERIDEARKAAGEIMRITPQFSLAAQKANAADATADRDQFYGDLVKAGLK
jgi:hypothetical protein